MTRILEHYKNLPGTDYEITPKGIQLTQESGGGKGTMLFMRLFPGIYLILVQIYADRWREIAIGEDLRGLKVNWCAAGRGEVTLEDGSFFYIQERDFAVSSQAAEDNFMYYPTNRYEGIEMFFDIEYLKQSPYLTQLFGFDVLTLEEKYCGSTGSYLGLADTALQNAFMRLWRISRTDDLFHLKMFTLELIQCLMSGPKDGGKMPEIYTESQVSMAKHAEKILTQDLRRHIPMREIAAQFGISESSLKNYFRGVFGQNVSLYMREYRVAAAAELLEKTKEPISLVADRVGYGNQGKFAAVFKASQGMSPLEYRRKKRMEKVQKNT